MGKPAKGKASEKKSIRTKSAKAQPQRTTSEPNADLSLEERIRRRAYEIFEARGRALGNAMEDWLRAESEILKDPEDG
jgi:malate/lactate dehydrogenase